MSVRTLSQQKLSASMYNKLKSTMPLPKGSVYFDGNGDYLTVANATPLNMGTGDFCIEFWWKPTTLTSFATPFDKGFTSTGGILMQGSTESIYASGSIVITASSMVTNNQWNHVALVRNSGTLTLYHNGASVGSASNSTNFSNTSSLLIGTDSSLSTASQFPGYISNFRMVKGSPVYTGGFTPPTSPLTAIAGTTLLTCHLPTAISDGSSNNYTVTANGNAVASSSSPFS